MTDLLDGLGRRRSSAFYQGVQVAAGMAVVVVVEQCICRTESGRRLVGGSCLRLELVLLVLMEIEREAADIK